MALFDNFISSVKFDVLDTTFIISFFKNANSLVSTLPCLIVGGAITDFSIFFLALQFISTPQFTEILKISYRSQSFKCRYMCNDKCYGKLMNFNYQ